MKAKFLDKTRESGRLHFKAAFLCGLLLAVFAEVAASQEPVVDPPGRTARLSVIEGDVTLAPAGSNEWADALLNRPMTTGDQLWLEDAARAELQVGNATVHLDEKTAFSFIELDDDVMQMSVTEGVATIRVRRRGEREVIQVETPNSTVSLLHPGEYTIEVDPRVDQTIVRTRNGDAEVLAGDDAHTVRAGEEGRFTGLDTVQADTATLGPRSAFETWANERERRYERAESSRYVSRDMVGYEDLDEHGEWVYEREYGHVWRPLHVSSEWAPYRYGRWVWMSPWGWTWVDDARWGFAPFHYGRWAHVRDRWYWVPGPTHVRPVYGPAFVGWYGGSSSSVSISIGSGVGWYPLGPREIYVPAYRHSPRYVRYVNHSNTIVVNNTYITNVYSGRGWRHDYRYRHHPHAVTFVGRDQFVRGRPLGDFRLRLDERALRDARADHRPPAITPTRDSVLAGLTRARDRYRDGGPRLSNGMMPGRIGFDDERRLIETNNGRPPGRSELRDRVKDQELRRPRLTWRDDKHPEGVLNRARDYRTREPDAALREQAIRSPERWRDRQSLDNQRRPAVGRDLRDAERTTPRIESLRAIENGRSNTIESRPRENTRTWRNAERESGVESRLRESRNAIRNREADRPTIRQDRGQSNDSARYAPRNQRIESAPAAGREARSSNQSRIKQGGLRQQER